MSILDAVEEAVRARQPDYPPEKSAGGTNTLVVKACDVVGYTPGYCVCLNKISAFERDTGLSSYPDCERAIRNRECRALAMRAEELAAGKALYYVDRTLLREEMDRALDKVAAPYRPAPAKPRPSAFEAARTTAPKLDAPVKTKPLRPSTPSLAPAEDGYAAAINAALKEATAQPKPEPKPEPKIEPKPQPKVTTPQPSTGKPMSLLDIARMHAGVTHKGT